MFLMTYHVLDAFSHERSRSFSRVWVGDWPPTPRSQRPYVRRNPETVCVSRIKYNKFTESVTIARTGTWGFMVWRGLSVEGGGPKANVLALP